MSVLKIFRYLPNSFSFRTCNIKANKPPVIPAVAKNDFHVTGPRLPKSGFDFFGIRDSVLYILKLELCRGSLTTDDEKKVPPLFNKDGDINLDTHVLAIISERNYIS